MNTILTERLLLKEHTVSDLQNMFELFSDDDVMKYVGFEKHVDINSTFVKLASILSDRNAQFRKHYYFTVFKKNTTEYIGEIGITIQQKQDNSGIADLGYFFHKKYWGLGFATEASNAIVKYSFETLKMHKVIASCQKENISSEKIMIKIGMVKEAELKMHRYKNGVWFDELKYGLCKKDYNNA